MPALPRQHGLQRAHRPPNSALPRNRPRPQLRTRQARLRHHASLGQGCQDGLSHRTGVLGCIRLRRRGGRRGWAADVDSCSTWKAELLCVCRCKRGPSRCSNRRTAAPCCSTATAPSPAAPSGCTHLPLQPAVQRHGVVALVVAKLGVVARLHGRNRWQGRRTAAGSVTAGEHAHRLLTWVPLAQAAHLTPRRPAIFGWLRQRHYPVRCKPYAMRSPAAPTRRSPAQWRRPGLPARGRRHRCPPGMRSPAAA